MLAAPEDGFSEEEDPMAGSKYKVCDKCGVRHSTLVRHKCFKPEDQKDPPKFDDIPPGGEDGEGSGGEGGGPEQERDGQGQSDRDSDGDQSEGDGDGEESDQDGEDQQKQKQNQKQQQAPQDQQQQEQEEEIPPVAVVVTVLKFALLTAASVGKENDLFIEVLLTEAGLLIRGEDDDGSYRTRLIPWAEFEKRATLDGEYYVKETIDLLAEDLKGKDEKF